MKTITEKIGKNEVLLTGYLHDPHYSMPDYDKRPAIVILGGGGYEFVSFREKEPVAGSFYMKGYHVFTLMYSVEEKAQDMQPMIELAQTIKFLREKSEEWGILPDKIATIGFSAGGHLAACGGVMPDNALFMERSGFSNADEIRANAMILSYPVITSGEFAHKGSIDRLMGDATDEKLREAFSLEKNVTEKTPPTFLWHAADDTCVKVENSILMASALSANKIPFELHIFNEGGHGMSMCTAEVGHDKQHLRHWFELCTEWLNSTFDFRS
ncbi:MAG: alpha/beta hydrolase [Clostridia bacterium]|nr:alpha/beta hydrolase [Clostridia bacterium]